MIILHEAPATFAMTRPILGMVIPAPLAAQPGGEAGLSNARMHMEAAKQASLSAYCFTLADVDIEKMQVKGWVLEAERWVQYILPWPDLFYFQTGKIAIGQESNAFHHLMATAIPINSTCYLGKWQCYSILAKYPDTQAMLPATVQYHKPEDLLTMLKQHGAVFTKPEWGSLGRGISRVWKTDDERFGWWAAHSPEMDDDLSADEMIELVKETVGKSSFVVQAEIPLYEVDERRLDMRIDLQRNGAGQWVVGSVAGTRMGQPGMYITNNSQGADWIPFPDGMKFFAKTALEEDRLWSQIAKASLAITGHLEDHCGRMGEIGLDLAFDKQLQLWFLEANPMPAKTPNRMENGLLYPKHTLIVDYARYLYGVVKSSVQPW